MFSVYKSKSENLSTFENLSTLDLSTASLRPPDGSNNWSDRSNFFVRPNRRSRHRWHETATRTPLSAVN